LDVLVVDLDALTAVDRLHFADQILLHCLDATDAQNVVWHQRPNYQRIALADSVARVDAQVLAVRHQVFAFFADRFAGVVGRLNPDGALAAFLITQPDDASDLGHDGRIARPARLEDFRDPRQTAGDVLRAADFPRCLGQERAGRDLLAIADFQVRLLR